MPNIEGLKAIFSRESEIFSETFAGSMTIPGFYAPFPLRHHMIYDSAPKLERYVEGGRNVLDLGSAFGTAMLGLAYLGGVCKGIDASKNLVNYANNTAEQLAGEHYIERGSSVSYLGNYFPPDDNVDESVKWDKWKEGPQILKTNPYEEMGLTISHFDVITVYQYRRNLPDTLRLISHRAKDKAKVVIWNYVPEKIPANFTLIDRLAHATVFEKNS
jgi:SAM-dependent methyltransferase